MAKKVYLVGAVLSSGKSETGPIVDLTTIADGAVGVCVAFSNKKKARKYSGNKYEIIELEVTS